MYGKHCAKNLDTREICQDYNSSKTYDNVPIRKLLIANISSTTRHRDLIEAFSYYGKIVNCILKIKGGGKKSYAFITYSKHEEAKRAMEVGYLRRFHIDNQYLRVLPAASWNQPDSIENQKLDDQCVSNKEQNVEYKNYVVQDKASINLLNNDCLMLIFTYLPIVDRVKIERVCKRWQIVSQESWHMHQKFDLIPSKWGCGSSLWDCRASNKYINAPSVYKVLCRCGPYLTHVDLSENVQNLGNATLIAIAKLCPNIQSIIIRNLNVSASGIKALANNCNNITNFTIGRNSNSFHNSYTDALSLLFLKNRKLKYLEINCDGIIGKCFLHLPAKSIQQLVLIKPNVRISNDFCNVIKKLQNLHTLKIYRESELDGFLSNSEVINAIGSQSQHLKVLELTGNKSTSSFSYLDNCPKLNLDLIGEFMNLRTLNMSGNSFLNDNFLIKLGINCKQLSTINISGCLSVTNRGLANISSLPKLEHLFINEIINVTDEVLTDMLNLKSLHCCNCVNIHYVGLIALIRTSENIELLNLTNCRLVSNELIDTAVEVTKSRNYKILKIYVAGTSVKIDETKEFSPFLQVLTTEPGMSRKIADEHETSW